MNEICKVWKSAIDHLNNQHREVHIRICVGFLIEGMGNAHFTQALTVGTDPPVATIKKPRLICEEPAQLKYEANLERVKKG